MNRWHGLSFLALMGAVFPVYACAGSDSLVLFSSLLLLLTLAGVSEGEGRRSLNRLLWWDWRSCQWKRKVEDLTFLNTIEGGIELEQKMQNRMWNECHKHSSCPRDTFLLPVSVFLGWLFTVDHCYCPLFTIFSTVVTHCPAMTNAQSSLRSALIYHPSPVSQLVSQRFTYEWMEQTSQKVCMIALSKPATRVPMVSS